MINRHEYEDCELLLALREELNHDTSDYRFTDDEILGPFGELHCVLAAAATRFHPRRRRAARMQQRCYLQMVRSTMVLSLTEADFPYLAQAGLQSPPCNASLRRVATRRCSLRRRQNITQDIDAALFGG